MKKLIITTALLSIIFSGCSKKTVEPTEAVMETGKYEVLVTAEANKEIDDENDLFYKDMIKRAMKKAAETTLKFEKTHFALVSMRTNNMAGFPINTYQNLQKFCLSDLNAFECDSIKHKNRSTLKLLLLSDLDYRMIAFDAKQVLEDIKNDK